MLWHGKNFRGIINKAKQMIFDNTGTDLVSTNAEDAIKEVNSKLSSETETLTGTVKVAKSGKLVTLSFDESAMMSMTAGTNYITLSEKYRPLMTCSFDDTNDTNTGKHRIIIKPDGGVTTQTTFTNVNIRGSITYITA